MGTILALVAALCAVGSIGAAMKPALIGQESRFKAFVLCWGLTAISTDNADVAISYELNYRTPII